MAAFSFLLFCGYIKKQICFKILSTAKKYCLLLLLVQINLTYWQWRNYVTLKKYQPFSLAFLFPVSQMSEVLSLVVGTHLHCRSHTLGWSDLLRHLHL